MGIKFQVSGAGQAARHCWEVGAGFDRLSVAYGLSQNSRTSEA